MILSEKEKKEVAETCFVIFAFILNALKQLISFLKLRLKVHLHLFSKQKQQQAVILKF